jgi:hypothetical protein
LPHDGPQRQKQAHRAEFHALGKSPCDQCRRDDGEHELVNHVRLRRDGWSVIRIGRQAHAMHEGVVQAADEGVAGAECQAVAHQRPQHRDDAHHGEALHHRGQNVLAANQAAIEEREAWAGHHQHQCGAGQHPGVIAGRNRGGRRRLGQCGGSATKGK